MLYFSPLIFYGTIQYGNPVSEEIRFMSLTELYNTRAHHSSAINRLAMSQQQATQASNQCLALGGIMFRTQLFIGNIQNVLHMLKYVI